jgi:scyllo-inositol 2-dehydrogenase (NADP+)
MQRSLIRRPNPSENIRVGVIGLGRSGRFFHCRPLQSLEGYELVAVADSRESEASAAGAEYGCYSHADYRELLERKDVDLVVVATPTRLHSEMTLDAIGAGKHVLVEKPFASGSREAREMFAAGQGAGVFVGGFHNRRYDACVQSIRDVLSGGSLGPIVHTGIRLHSYTRRQDWQTLRSHGGGALSNWGAHILDWCIYLFGTEIKVVQVQLVHALNPGDTEDGFYLLLKCPDGSLVSVEYFNCVARGLPRWHVIGQTGSAIYDKNKLHVRYCDPTRLIPISAEAGASDGTYGVEEDLGWTEKESPVAYRDNSIFFYEALAKHLKYGAPAPVSEPEVVRLMEIIESLRTSPVRQLERFHDSGEGEAQAGLPPLRGQKRPSVSMV